MSTDKPTYAQPPLARDRLFDQMVCNPRVANRLGSVRTDLGGVPEHWPKDIAPIFYPDLPNPLVLLPILPQHGLVVVVSTEPAELPGPQDLQGVGEKTPVEVPGGREEVKTGASSYEPPGISGPTMTKKEVEEAFHKAQADLFPPEETAAEVTEVAEAPTEAVEVTAEPEAITVAQEPSQSTVTSTEVGYPTHEIWGDGGT